MRGHADRWTVPAGFLLAAVVFCLPSVLLVDMPQNDVAARYAPMVAEFARGNWTRAFHPRCPPLTTTIGGLLAYLPLTPLQAVKLASALLFAAGVFPLYWLYRECCGRRAALSCCLLYVVAPRLLRLGGSGLRDAGKVTCFVLACMAVMRLLRKREWWTAPVLGIGMAGMILSRGDGLAVAVALLGVFALLEFGTLPVVASRLETFLPRTVAAAAICALLSAPWVFYMVRQTGYPVTDVQQIGILRKFEHAMSRDLRLNRTPAMQELPVLPNAPLRSPEPEPPPDPQPPEAATPPAAVHAAFFDMEGVRHQALTLRIVWEGFVSEVVRGLFPPYLALAGLGIWFRIRRGRWRTWESLIAFLLVLHTGGMVLQSLVAGYAYTDRRYVVAGLPLILFWSVLGVRVVRDWSTQFLGAWGKRVLAVGIGVGLVVLVLDGASAVRRHYRDENRRMRRVVLESAEWLRGPGRARLPADATSVPTCWHRYHNGRTPAILTARPVVSLHAGADVVPWPRVFRMTRESLTDYCVRSGVHYVVSDPWLRERAPLLREWDTSAGSPPTELALAARFGGDGQHRIAIFAVLPNLVPTAAPSPAPESAVELRTPQTRAPGADAPSPEAAKP